MAATIEANGVRAGDRLVWIVVQSHPGQEVRAKTELRNQGFEVYLPMRLFQNRKGVTVGRPFFPGYLFAHVSPWPQEWREIFSTYGVASVLGCTPARAVGVKDKVVERLKAAEEGGYIKMGLADEAGPRGYGRGERVCVDVGPYADLEALFLETVDVRRVRLLISLFGRDSDVLVELRHIRKP